LIYGATKPVGVLRAVARASEVRSSGGAARVTSAQRAVFAALGFAAWRAPVLRNGGGDSDLRGNEGEHVGRRDFLHTEDTAGNAIKESTTFDVSEFNIDSPAGPAWRSFWTFTASPCTRL
jgi:hypothetical protein